MHFSNSVVGESESCAAGILAFFSVRFFSTKVMRLCVVLCSPRALAVFRATDFWKEDERER